MIGRKNLMRYKCDSYYFRLMSRYKYIFEIDKKSLPLDQILGKKTISKELNHPHLYKKKHIKYEKILKSYCQG